MHSDISSIVLLNRHTSKHLRQRNYTLVFIHNTMMSNGAQYQRLSPTVQESKRERERNSEWKKTRVILFIQKNRYIYISDTRKNNCILTVKVVQLLYLTSPLKTKLLRDLTPRDFLRVSNLFCRNALVNTSAICSSLLQ